jgi:flagellar motility protein MotE (MotC chaperone)
MLRRLQSPWLVALCGCLLYLATTAALIRPEQFAGLSPPTAPRVTPNDDPAWKFHNPEFEQWLEEVKQEKEALATKAQQLHELQMRLEAERQEILSVTQTVHQLQMEFDKNVIRIKEQQVENLKRQTKVIAGMSPEGAAAMLKELPDDEVVRILVTLNTDGASLILDTMSKLGKPEAQRAATLAERMRMVLPPNSKNSRTKPPG